MKSSKAMGVFLAAPAMCALAFAQTGGTGTGTGSTAACTTAPTSVSALNIERVVPLSNIGTTLTPNAPANVLTAIAGGAQEIHEQLVYNPQLSTVTSTVFLTAVASPIPTPGSGITSANTIATTAIQVSQVLSSCNPTPSIMLVGTVTSPSNGIYGSFNGAPAAVAVGYSNGSSSTTISNVVVLIAGQVVEYSQGASGTLTFPSSTGTGTGTGTGNRNRHWHRRWDYGRRDRKWVDTAAKPVDSGTVQSIDAERDREHWGYRSVNVHV